MVNMSRLASAMMERIDHAAFDHVLCFWNSVFHALQHLALTVTAHSDLRVLSILDGLLARHAILLVQRARAWLGTRGHQIPHPYPCGCWSSSSSFALTCVCRYPQSRHVVTVTPEDRVSVSSFVEQHFGHQEVGVMTTAQAV